MKKNISHKKKTKLNRKNLKMKTLYGCADDTGEIYTAYNSPDEAPGLDLITLYENPTWEDSDFTSKDGTNYIRADRLAYLFNELCNRSGMKKKAIAALCGKTPTHISRYCKGLAPIPVLVWQAVERLANDRKR
jgi:hypothetical protein